MNASVSSLLVGDRVVSRCDDGLLEVEYALFDRAEVLLASSSASGRGVREQGYMTTAGFARARLYEALVTSDLAHEAFSAMRGRHVRPLARSHAVAEIIDQLGPYEAFQGGAFVAERGRYAGVWLDLDALAGACPLREAALLFQALHLVLVLEEVTEDVPVRLLTAGPAGEGQPGERTWRKVELDAVQRLPWILREMQAASRPHGAGRDEAEVREEILRDLRARATGTAVAEPRLDTLAAALARTGWTPPAGIRLEHTPAPATKRMSSRPPRPSPAPSRASSSRPPPGSPAPPPLRAPLAPAAAPIHRTADPSALFATLRQHNERLRGDHHLRAVAQSLSSLVEHAPFVPDLAILAARAWLAAGEQGYARHFARRVVEDASVADDLRIGALEILDATPKTHETVRPPPAQAATQAIQPERVIVLSAEVDRPGPPGASLPPMGPGQPAELEFELEAPPSFVPALQPGVVAATVLGPPTAALAKAPAAPGRPEIVETLPLPAGLTEDLLPAGVVPSDTAQVRVAMTRLARQLGRDYRLTYGTTLKTDLVAIDAMQRHIRRRFADAPLDDKHARQLQVELTRHGALMSEILARILGARWTDLSSEEPGHWAMAVPPGVTVWPIGRVYRFYGQGQREADLVAFFMELEAGARRG